mgnify:FL=1
MLIQFLGDGESPERGVGIYFKGEERDLPPEIAQGFIKRGICIMKTKTVKSTDRKEGKDNGRD